MSRILFVGMLVQPKVEDPASVMPDPDLRPYISPVVNVVLSHDAEKLAEFSISLGAWDKLRDTIYMDGTIRALSYEALNEEREAEYRRAHPGEFR